MEADKVSIISDKERLDGELNMLKGQLSSVREQLVAERTVNSQLQQRQQEMRQEFAHSEEQRRMEHERIDNERRTEFNRRTETLKIEFQNMAEMILKARSEELTKSNDERLGLLLKPLNEHLKMFREQVEKAFDTEMRDKNSLREEIHRLTELNTKMSVDANNLTRALKGDVKQQGCWGEVVLERVLESSGLTEGREYHREVVVQDDEGTVYRPDVIVNLPDNKHIVIDSKVSLVAYTRWVEAENDEMRKSAQNDLIMSVNSHIKLLSEKHYERAKDLNTPDFVLLFMPVEGAFSVAVQTQSDIYSKAWERKIVIVSPSTLLATMRTVSSIWQQENQTRNAQEIARIAGALYDKLAAMRADFDDINSHLEKAQKSYIAAMNKLSDGRDSIYSKANRLRDLGAKTTKQLQQQ
ncbi:MAG: DNA recombination protein RmuC [Candidatus Aphodosoma sp.]